MCFVVERYSSADERNHDSDKSTAHTEKAVSPLDRPENAKNSWSMVSVRKYDRRRHHFHPWNEVLTLSEFVRR